MPTKLYRRLCYSSVTNAIIQLPLTNTHDPHELRSLPASFTDLCYCARHLALSMLDLATSPHAGRFRGPG